jgi:hypothetical protein
MPRSSRGTRPLPNWFLRRDAVIAFISSTGSRRCVTSRRAQTGSWRSVGTWWSAGRDHHRPTSIEVLTLEGERVKEIVAFALSELFPRFGLPPELSGR